MRPEKPSEFLPATAIARVTVEAPGRLHMGFLDLGGALGRKFGSIGVGLNEIATRLMIEPAERLIVAGPDAERAAQAVARISAHAGRPFHVAIRVDAAVPHHAGLGSGTQMALAVGAGLARLYGLGLGVRDIAAIIERGARSGIGIAVFEQGGLVVDAGRGERTVVPPVISRLEMPAAWRFIIVLDRRDQGLHGAAEIEAFRALPVFPAEAAARLCHLLVMRGLPAVAEGDLAGFGSVITALQSAVGDHFAPAQGGRFTSPDVGAAIDFLASRGAVGLGQSSWGPTGFCMVESPSLATSLLEEARIRFSGNAHLDFLIGTARNRGADISADQVQPPYSP